MSDTRIIQPLALFLGGCADQEIFIHAQDCQGEINTRYLRSIAFRLNLYYVHVYFVHSKDNNFKEHGCLHSSVYSILSIPPFLPSFSLALGLLQVYYYCVPRDFLLFLNLRLLLCQICNSAALNMRIAASRLRAKIYSSSEMFFQSGTS